MLKRFKSYSGHFGPMRKTFVLALVLRIIASAANGFGLAFMIDRVFPVIFPDEEGALANAPAWLASMVAWFVGRDRLDEYILYGACAMLPLVFIVKGLADFGSTFLISTYKEGATMALDPSKFKSSRGENASGRRPPLT